MVQGLKNVLVKAGHEREFETLFAELRAEMRKHEPGRAYYSRVKSRTKPRAYIAEEQYRDGARGKTISRRSARFSKASPSNIST